MAMEVPRKTVLAGAGIGLAAAAVAACSGGSTSQSGSAPESKTDTASGTDSSGTSSSSEPAGKTLTSTADVPVGAGVIVGEVVVTQPVAGEYKAFSAVCTHNGCHVDKIADGAINCPSHGSRFGLDGAVVNGPAEKPLQPVAVRVQGDSIIAE